MVALKSSTLFAATMYVAFVIAADCFHQPTLVDELTFLSPSEKRFIRQVQGRTYANMFGPAERFIGAKMLEISRDHWHGDQITLEALVRFTEEQARGQVFRYHIRRFTSSLTRH